MPTTNIWPLKTAYSGRKILYLTNQNR